MKKDNILIWVVIIAVAIYLLYKEFSKEEVKEASSNNNRGIGGGGGGFNYNGGPSNHTTQPAPPVYLQWNRFGVTHTAEITRNEDEIEVEPDVAVASMAKFCN